MREATDGPMWPLSLVTVLMWLVISGGGALAVVAETYAAGHVGEEERRSGEGEFVIFFDDFEDGVPWSTEDVGATEPVWHPDVYHAWSGKSWWCGEVLSQNPVVRGYLDDWYQVLDTPALSFVGYSAPITLTFKSRYKVEPPGAEPPFDGWDGSNVRVSTDGGGSFSVVTPVEGSYTHSSLFGFGDQHCEGYGVPGWCGGDDTWGDVSFDLSAYAGMDDVVVRFAFASDRSWCTPSGDTSAHGWFVDDIVVASGVDTIFSDDGEDTTPLGQMAPRNNYAGGVWGGDLWMKTTVDAYSGMYSWNCDDSLRMNAALISPPIDLPTDWDSLRFSYYVYADFQEDNGYGELGDYYHIEISSDDGQSWDEICYDYAYNGSDEGWVKRRTGLRLPGPNTVPLDLLPYAGQAIRLRWRLVTDCNDDGENTTGLYIDDVKVYAKMDLPAPFPLETRDSLGHVYLWWGVGESAELAYDDGTFETTFAASQAGRCWAVRMDGWEGISRLVDTVKFRVTLPETVDVCGWDDTGPMVHDHKMPADSALYRVWGVMPEADGWTEVDVSDSGWIFDGDFYVGYLQRASTVPRCCLDTTNVDDHRSVLYQLPFGWDTWTNISDGTVPNANFMIRACLKTVEGLVGFNLYRSMESGHYDEPLVSLPPTQFSYLDTTVELGVTYYYVATTLVVVYEDTMESAFSQEVSITPLGPYRELSYDDGTADGGFSIGPGGNLAVLFTPLIYPTKVERVSFLTFGNGEFVPKVWDDDGVDGAPFTELYSGDTVMVVDDAMSWIFVDDVVIEDGEFYVGWEETENAPSLGYDEDDPDHDRAWYRYSGWDWGLLSTLMLNYDLMIRALVREYNEAVQEDISAQVPDGHVLCRSYPNPFNPTTEIVYQVPRAERVQLYVYNVLGQRVRSLVDGEQAPGVHRALWDGRDQGGRDVASGVYVIRVGAGGTTASVKAVLVR